MENIKELKDSKIIAEILNKAFITVAEQYGFTRENAPIFPAFINPDRVEANLSRGLKMYGYEIDGKTAGCAGYSFYKDEIYIIERLAVLPEYRHMGIGKKLMEFIENEIRKNNGKTAEVHVVDKNIVLREWYKKLGYREIRIDKIKTMPFNSCVMIKEPA